MIASKPGMVLFWFSHPLSNALSGTWAQAGLPGAPNTSQPSRDAVAPDNWAQAMGTRTSAQLDLSASSYVALS